MSDFRRKSKRYLLTKYLIIIFVVIFSILAIRDMFQGQKVQVSIKKTNIGDLTKQQKLEDFNYLYNILNESYPFFSAEKRKFDYDWVSNRSTYEEMLSNTKDNSEFYFQMNKILTLLQNGHTHVISPEFYDELYTTYSKGLNNSWKQVIYDKKVQECYDYWRNNLKYSLNFVPLYFVYIEGGYYLYAPDKNYKEFADKNNIPEGSKLININDTPVDEYIKMGMSEKLLSYDNLRRKHVVTGLTLESDKPAKFSLKLLTEEGEEIVRIVDSKIYSYEYKERDIFKAQSENVRTGILVDKKVAYLGISSFSINFIDEDSKVINPFLQSIKDYPNLIIDIRGNSGGSFNYWIKNLVQPLADRKLSWEYYTGFRGGSYITNYLEDSISYSQQIPADLLPNYKSSSPELKDYNIFVKDNIVINPGSEESFKGKVFILVDDKVYSSADAFTSFSKATNWATIVGTQTGGDGIGFDPAYVALPNSGLLVRFSFGLGINPDGTINEETHTSPDIFLEPSYKDFKEFLSDRKPDGSQDYQYKYDTVLKGLLELLK